MEKKSVGYIEGNLKIRYKYPLGDHVVEAIFLSLFTLGLWYGVYFLSGQLPDLLLDKLFPDVMPGGEQLLFSILLWIALLVILLIPLAMMRLLYKLVCKLVNTWHLEAEGNLFILSAGPLPWLGQNNKFALADISRFENRVLIGGGGVKTGSSTHSHNLVAIFKNKHTRILMTGFPNEETAKELAEICNSWV